MIGLTLCCWFCDAKIPFYFDYSSEEELTIQAHSFLAKSGWHVCGDDDEDWYYCGKCTDEDDV